MLHTFLTNIKVEIYIFLVKREKLTFGEFLYLSPDSSNLYFQHDAWVSSVTKNYAKFSMNFTRPPKSLKRSINTSCAFDA